MKRKESREAQQVVVPVPLDLLPQFDTVNRSFFFLVRLDRVIWVDGIEDVLPVGVGWCWAARRAALPAFPAAGPYI
jgi:hypothetical protein